MGIDFLTLSAAKGYTEESLQGAGALKGQDGFSPIIEENENNTDKIYKLDITTADGTFTTPNLKGKDGKNSEGGEANVIESISVNGTPISVDENKNVDITVPSIDGLTKDADLATVAKSGDYEDLINKPTIPSLNGYATETWVNEQGYLTEHQDLSAYATKDEIPTVPSKVSELTNDSNYQTAEQVNSTVTTEIAKVVADAPEDLNTLKEMSDWIAGHEDDASAMNSAISDNKTAITALQAGKADKSEIPTTLPANGGNADTVNNHTVESDVPTDAVFTDTIYDDTEVKESIAELNSNLVNIDIVANSNLNADTWAADFFGLPNTSQRTIYNVYNYNTGKFSHLCKRKDGAILSDLEITNGVKYHISGFNS